MSDETKSGDRSIGLEREVRELRFILKRIYSLMFFVVAMWCLAVLTWLFFAYVSSRSFRVISTNGTSVQNQRTAER